jgi:hypothetical protein
MRFRPIDTQLQYTQSRQTLLRFNSEDITRLSLHSAGKNASDQRAKNRPKEIEPVATSPPSIAGLTAQFRRLDNEENNAVTL